MRIDLVINSAIRLNGGYISNDRINPDMIGYIVPREHPNVNKKFMAFDSGSYLVTFTEAPLNVGTPTLFEISQSDLMRCGAYLVLNKEPFTGLLVVTRPLAIDEGSRVATLHYENFLMMDENVEGEE